MSEKFAKKSEAQLTCGENAEVETHSVVLVGDKEEETVAHDGPDHDVGQDSGGQRVCIDSGSANSEQEDVVKGQGTGNNGDVDKSRGSRVLEVEGREVEEVDDEQHLGKPEVAAAPEVDETEPEQVVEDEVRANISGSLDVDLILRVQVPAVSNLQDEQDDHVNRCDDRVEGKGSVVVRVLVPDGASVVLALGGRIEGVVDAGNDQEEPRGSRQDLVASKATGGVRLAVHKGVHCVC